MKWFRRSKSESSEVPETSGVPSAPTWSVEGSQVQASRTPAAAPSSAHPIIDFWAWWEREGRLIDPSEPSFDAAAELTKRLARIDPGLTFHFGPGEGAAHRLTVSAGGVAEVRRIAERWFRAAPSPSETWEFSPSKQADPSAMANVLQIAGEELSLEEMRFEIDRDDNRLRVHVGVYHPVFDRVSEDLRAQAGFLVLDWLLGEDDVERWLGEVGFLTEMPAYAQPSAALADAVAQTAAQANPDEWVVAEGTTPEGYPVLALFRYGARWLDAPTCDRHHLLTVEYPAQENGLPGSEQTLNELSAIDDEFQELLGTRGVFVGTETGQGARLFHAYTDGEDQNADDALAAWARARGLALVSESDPSWRAVRHLTG